MKDSLGDSALEIFNDRSPFCHRTKNFLFEQIVKLFLLGFILQSQKRKQTGLSSPSMKNDSYLDFGKIVDRKQSILSKKIKKYSDLTTKFLLDHY